MTDPDPANASLPVFRAHPRSWDENAYVYPVISRRSRGLSIGVNLNPDTACNFDCIYCQVDRTVEPRVRSVDLDRLGAELAGMLELAAGGELYAAAPFDQTPPALRRVNDIAFSGDGEPTTCPLFSDAIALAAELADAAGMPDIKLVLITDACYLTRPSVEAGLRIMDRHHGEIWAKLDAGTEDYYQQVNRPNYPLTHVLDNIIAAARQRPLCIQSLFMRIDGIAPAEAEIDAYLHRLADIIAAGGQIKEVQVYTVARRPAVDTVTALHDDEVDVITRRVRKETGLHAVAYYGA